MRLIDADLLIKELKGCTCTDKHDERIIKEFVVHIVKQQPTTYNMEEVVKEVQDIGTSFCTSVHCDNECENCDHGSIMKAVIDVIRKGGAK